MQPGPCRLVTLQTEYSLQAQRAGAVLLARHPPHSSKPNRQGSPRILENRARCHRRLAPALGTFPNPTHWPRLPRFAPRAGKTPRPPKPCQVCPTCFLGAETRLQFRQVLWILFHHVRILHIGAT